MFAFHVDMNMAHYRGDYLRKWLKILADNGYDAIIWELEANVCWDTCPECSAPGAFTKQEFREILEYSRNLGLEPVPLLQTIGHCEYVLKNSEYAHLRESTEIIDQYCPLNPDVLVFIRRWIEEYLELFGEIKYFHVGADEACFLGICEICRDYVRNNSLSELYIGYVNKVCEPLLVAGIRPVIWADMLLTYPEALAKLSRNIWIFDWMYDLRNSNPSVFIWGTGNCKQPDIPASALERFGEYLYPAGMEPGKEPNVFYSADYLAAAGFNVLTCPASSSFGDNVFSLRNWYHLANVKDSFRKGAQPHLRGSVLTSWSVHQFPWEQQLACIELPAYMKKHPDACIREFADDFAAKHFGLEGDEFLTACSLLSDKCLFSHTSSLGFGKPCLPVPEDHVKSVVSPMSGSEIKTELDNCRKRLAEYEEGFNKFCELRKCAVRGVELLDIWCLHAEAIVLHAKSAILILENASVLCGEGEIDAGSQRRAERLLDNLKSMEGRVFDSFSSRIKNERSREICEWIYKPLKDALALLLCK